MYTPCQSLCDSQKSLSRASNVFLKLFDVLFFQRQLVLALLEKKTLTRSFSCSFVFFSKVVCGWYWWSSDYVEKRQWCGVGPPVDVRMFAINRRNVRPKLEMDFIGKLSQWWTSTLRKGKLSFSIRIGGYVIISIHFKNLALKSLLESDQFDNCLFWKKEGLSFFQKGYIIFKTIIYEYIWYIW